jgi:L-ectoine synthase
MRVVSIKDFIGTEREVHFKEGVSVRPILKNDHMGFSVHKTIIPKGQKGHWHYTHHLESCYCIQGKGILTDLTTGIMYDIVPDTIYSLDKHDDHMFEALEDTILISIFNPPCTGQEVHNEDGSYSI